MLSLLMGRRGSTTNASWRIRHVKASKLCVFAVIFGCASFCAFGQIAGKESGPAAQPAAEAQKAASEQPGAAQQPASPAAAVSPREQLAKDCATLLKLSKELKVEIKKAGPDTLSLEVIRKSEEIQKLAHKIREEMKPLAGKK